MDTRPARLFVSYARKDIERVAPIVRRLAETDLRPWVDLEGLQAGTDYGPEIVTAIRRSRAVLLMLSNASMASRNVHQEVKLAWDAERPIIPVRLEPAAVPDRLKFWLEGIQYVDASDQAFDQKLIEAVQSSGSLMRNPPKRFSRLVLAVGMAFVALALLFGGLLAWRQREAGRSIAIYRPFVLQFQELQRSGADLRDHWRALSKVRLTTPEAHHAIASAQQQYYGHLTKLDVAWKNHRTTIDFNHHPAFEARLQRLRDAAFDQLHDGGIRRFDEVGAAINALELDPTLDDKQARSQLVILLENTDRQLEVFGEKVTEYVQAFNELEPGTR